MYKKLLFTIAILSLILLCATSVSANDVDNVNIADSGELNDNFDLNNENHTFDELSEIINNAEEGSTIVLDNDYQYVNGSNKGILINKSITIDGAGHKLIGNKLSRMFNVTADNVVLKNINFENGNAFGRYFQVAGGGAIYWSGANGIVENCNFTNNTGSGIEDDPFENEETIIDEDGHIIHVIRMRPMGCKINEGGAIVWNGTNGTVSKCIFINNAVGYPDSGGAICWRGNNGGVIDCEFYKNSAWCGAAICWMGDNGTVLRSIIYDNGFFDGGIYWFGSNGTVRYSILLRSGYAGVLRYYDEDVDADYNFWGDTTVNPYEFEKPSNVKNWFVMNITHNGEFVIKGDEVLIEYDLSNLFENGELSKDYGISDDRYNGSIIFVAPKTGFLNISFKDNKVNVDVDSKDRIVSSDLTKYYTNEISYKVTVYDVWGKVANGTVRFKVDGKVYYLKTDKNGVATLKLNLKPGKYTITTSYGDTSVKNKITVKTTLITKNLSKKVKKTAKFNVKVLNSKGKAYSKQLVKVKFKGKTYKIKTNSKGIATLKISNKLKVGKYTIKTTYNGITNTNKVIVKK